MTVSELLKELKFMKSLGYGESKIVVEIDGEYIEVAYSINEAEELILILKEEQEAKND